MDPIQIELVGQSSIPWNSIVAAVAAILASLGAGYLGYKWQGRNLDKQLAFQSGSEKINRKIRLLEQTLIPLRDAAANFRMSLISLAAAAYSGAELDLDKASNDFDKSLQTFGIASGKVTNEELAALAIDFTNKILAITQPYFRGLQEADRKRLFETVDSKIIDITDAAVTINKKIEQLLNGEDGT